MKISPGDLLLYGVTDRRQLSGESLEHAVEEAIKGGMTCVQLREKHLGDEKFRALAIKVQEVCARYGVPFIINDRVEIAKEIGADGVHVGQEDMSVAKARELLGEDFIIGTSAHNVKEAQKAIADGADYIGSGAVFQSSTKTDTVSLSLEELKNITALGIPVVAIGGVTAQNAHLLKGSGISGIAVSSAVFAQKDKKAAAELLRAVLKDTVK